MKRYEKILLVNVILMLLSGFGIVGALDTNMQVSVTPIITFIISTIVSGFMIFLQYLDN